MSVREQTHVGLDVHAHVVVGAALDAETGELVRRRLGSSPAEVLAWIRSLPGPVAAAYESTVHLPWKCRLLVLRELVPHREERAPAAAQLDRVRPSCATSTCQSSPPSADTATT